MKQLLFLLLFPCFAIAQYQGNANQKITLGEQTTADGLVYRGMANDTNVITPFSDTSAYIILDTVNSKFYHYNRTTTYWSLAGGGGDSGGVTSFSAGTTGLTPSTATTGAVTLGGTLAVANGGTGSATQNFVDLTTTQSIGGDKTFTSVVTGTKFIPTGTSASGNGIYLPVSNNISISTAGNENLRLTEKGNLGLGVDPDEMTSNNYKSIVLQGVTGGEIFLNNSTTNVGYIYANINGAVLDGKGTFRFQTNAVDRLIVYSGGNVGIGTQIPNTNDTATAKLHVVGNARITGNIVAGVTSATARLHLAAGTATASTAPLKFTSGTNLTTAEAGAMEFNGTNLFFSPSTTRHTVNHGLTGSATLDFPSTTTLLSADLTVTVTGAADGDVVSLGVPNAAVNANTCYTAWVSSANTVTIRFNNYSSGTVNPASGTFKVFVTK